MKTIIALAIASTLFASCKKASADFYVDNTSPKVNQTFHVENQSYGADISYVKMNGEGMLDSSYFMQKESMITNPRFNFYYTKPGTYNIQVFVENSSIFGGTETSNKVIKLVVTDQNAQPGISLPDVGTSINNVIHHDNVFDK